MDWRKLSCPPKASWCCLVAVGGGAYAVLDREAKEDEPMDYERLRASGESMVVYAAMIRLMTRRLARV